MFVCPVAAMSKNPVEGRFRKSRPVIPGEMKLSDSLPSAFYERKKILLRLPYSDDDIRLNLAQGLFQELPMHQPLYKDSMQDMQAAFPVVIIIIDAKIHEMHFI